MPRPMPRDEPVTIATRPCERSVAQTRAARSARTFFVACAIARIFAIDSSTVRVFSPQSGSGQIVSAGRMSTRLPDARLDLFDGLDRVVVRVDDAERQVLVETEVAQALEEDEVGVRELHVEVVDGELEHVREHRLRVAVLERVGDEVGVDALRS